MNTRTSPKTPYEIRLDLLQLAFDILTKKHEAAASAETYATGGSVLVKTSPTSEEVIAEAEKMNAFISKASGSH